MNARMSMTDPNAALQIDMLNWSGCYPRCSLTSARKFFSTGLSWTV